MTVLAVPAVCAQVCFLTLIFSLRVALESELLKIIANGE